MRLLSALWSFVSTAWHLVNVDVAPELNPNLSRVQQNNLSHAAERLNMLRTYDVMSVCSDLCSIRSWEPLHALRCFSKVQKPSQRGSVCGFTHSSGISSAFASMCCG